MTMTNEKFKLQIENGIITGLFADGESQTMVQPTGFTGTVGYTLISDDIRNQEKKTNMQYHILILII